MKATSCEHCGGFPSPRKGTPRSVPQNRRYFALIRAAYNHWPQKTKDEDEKWFYPRSEEHLRHYLQAKVGYSIIDTLDVAGMTAEHACAQIAAQVMKAGPFSFQDSEGTCFFSTTSQSIDFDTLPHLKACALFDAVAELIEAETGIRVDDMLKFTPRTKVAVMVPGFQR